MATALDFNRVAIVLAHATVLEGASCAYQSIMSLPQSFPAGLVIPRLLVWLLCRHIGVQLAHGYHTIGVLLRFFQANPIQGMSTQNPLQLQPLCLCLCLGNILGRASGG